MKSPAHLIALHLVSATDLVLGETLFVNHEPETPTDAVTLFDYGGLGTSYINGECDSEPKVQARVRASIQSDAINRIYELRDVILPLSGNKVDGDGLFAWLASGIFNLGRDKNDFFTFTDNYTLKVVRDA